MATAQQTTENKITELFNQKGAFFAFSKSQFAEKQIKGVEYVSLSSGLICPKENAKDLLSEMDAIYADGMKADLEENGLENIIYRELANHEAWYTYEIHDTMEALTGYDGVTEELVWKVFHANAHKYD